MNQPAMPESPTPRIPRRRFKSDDIQKYLDMNAIGQIFLAVSVNGYVRLLNSVWTQQSGSLKVVLDALDTAQTTEQLSKAAHSLKSEAGGLGLKALFELARDIELNALSYSSDTCATAAAQLRDCWDTSLALCDRMGFRV